MTRWDAFAVVLLGPVSQKHFNAVPGGMRRAGQIQGILESTKITAAHDVGKHLVDIPGGVIAVEGSIDGSQPYFRRAGQPRGNHIRPGPCAAAQPGLVFQLRRALLDELQDLAGHLPFRRAARGLEPYVQAFRQIDTQPLGGLGLDEPGTLVMGDMRPASCRRRESSPPARRGTQPVRSRTRPRIRARAHGEPHRRALQQCESGSVVK